MNPMHSPNGLYGTLSAENLKQIDALAKEPDASNKTIVAIFNGKVVTFSAVKTSKIKNSKTNKKAASEAVKRLGVRKGKSITPIQAKEQVKNIDAIIRGCNADNILNSYGSGMSAQTREIKNQVSDRSDFKDPPIYENLQPGSNPDSTIDSDTDSGVYGSNGSVGSGTYMNLPRRTNSQTSVLSEKVSQLVKDKKYREAHTQLTKDRKNSLIESQQVRNSNARWLRFQGNVPIPKATALKIDGKFIPANKIQLGNITHIASQAPKKGHGGDLWQAALDQDTSMICDLTNANDVKVTNGTSKNNKGGPIDLYTPGMEINDTMKFENGITVTCRGTKQEQGFTKTLYKVTDKNGKEQNIRRYHYTQWPDHGAPDTAVTESTLSQFILTIQNHMKSREFFGKPITHCIAGVGRTGTLLTLDTVYKELSTGKYTTQEAVDKLVFEIIHNGKDARGASFVQSVEQIDFIINTAHKWLENHMNGQPLIPPESNNK